MRTLIKRSTDYWTGKKKLFIIFGLHINHNDVFFVAFLASLFNNQMSCIRAVLNRIILYIYLKPLKVRVSSLLDYRHKKLCPLK